MIWKILTLVFAATSIVLLLVQIKQFLEYKRLHEPRLIGTWISDKQRTLEQFPEHLTEPQKEKLSSLFGKLRVTYTSTTYTTELEGKAETFPYTVLGVDKHSVVIRDNSAPNPDLDILERSTFYKIHFDGPDSYWVTTQGGGLVEYFRRMSDNPI